MRWVTEYGFPLSIVSDRDERELRELQQVERIRERLERELKETTDREKEIKNRAARLDTLEADKAKLEGLDDSGMNDPMKVLRDNMLSLHAHVDSRLDFIQSTLDQILDILTRPGLRPPAQSPLPLSAMSGPFPVQVGTQPSGTSAAGTQTVTSSSSGPAVIATSPQQPVQQSGHPQGQWYPKTPMKPPLAFSGERKDEELNTWLRTVPVWVKAKRTLPEDKVVTAASYLEGKAAKWLDGVVLKAGFGRRMADWAKSLTLDQFMEMVEARWHNPQEAQRATDAINKLDQRKFNEARLEYHSFETLSRKALDLEATLGNAQPSQNDTKKKKSPQEWKKKGVKLMMVESDGTQTEIDELSDLMDYSEYDGEEVAEGSTLATVVKTKAAGRGQGQPRGQGKAASNQTKQAEWVKAGLDQDVWHDRRVRGACINCGEYGHSQYKCQNAKVTQKIAPKMGASYSQGSSSGNADECEGAFKRLKHALMNHEVLMVPDPQKPFIVTTDASLYDIGAVMAQQDGNKLRAIEYMSKKMPSKKLAKSTYERELYVLYKAIVHWRHFLLGRFFYLRTDHQTLKWIKTQPALSDALKRWIEVIDKYDFKLEYLKGEYNKVADALSRRADYLGQNVSMDFMDTLVTSKSGKRDIFVIIDRFTKYARIVAMPETARIDYVIKLFKDNWVRDFGLPKSIVSDRDVRFTSELWKKTAEQMGSQLQMTSGNHPEANGQAEQMNRVVQHLLRHYIKPSQDDWDEELPLIASLYNNAIHSSTDVSPNQLHLGWKPRSALDFLLPENRPAATPGTLEYGVQYEKLLQEVVEHMKKAQQAMIAFENQHRRQSTFQFYSETTAAELSKWEEEEAARQQEIQRQLAEAEAARQQAAAEAAADARLQQQQVEASQNQVRYPATMELANEEATYRRLLQQQHFRANEEQEEPTEDERNKEATTVLMENLLYMCNWQQRELLAMQQVFIRHKTMFKAMDKKIATLQAEISTLQAANSQQQTINDQLQSDVSMGLARLSAVASTGSAVADCSPALAAQAKQLEEQINHVVASLGDISKFAGALTVNNQLQTLNDRVQQRPATVAKEWKMSNFKIEKFDDYHKTDPLQWWMAFNVEVDVHHTPELRRLDALYLQLIGGAQTFMTHMVVTLECTIATLHTKITWEEFEKQ
ncbi:hypothetical protein CBR_g39472 [Chara braunii]|uniref:Integrase catalytic domain-containing protein n=1 Tax=Chara braunii TaxID=69332 RepID=A0A388LRP1_CHABU|nr:hypothetical protein CBR_g39472 [Chara braunii]|eukprot:GBG85008.1 hypothetical protein CBR_g39472 [Chara braunii]